MIFNRFAKEARACVRDAEDEARALGHDSIGDEDLLLGILRAEDSEAAAALFSLGVTLEATREESEQMLSEALSLIGTSFEDIRREAGEAFDMSIFGGHRIPFSPRAKKALEQALKEAVQLRDNYIGTVHVLLGILRNEDGTAVRMLARLEVSAEALEERLYELHGREAV